MGRVDKDQLLALVRNGAPMTSGQRFKLALLLAIPAILAQLSSVMMQYIDTAMVGHLGANPSASIGLVSTSTWLFNGFFMAVTSGFSVQVAHRCGAKDFTKARTISRQGLFTVGIFSVILAITALAISGSLPSWLGGGPEINDDARDYFAIYAAFMPISAVGWAASVMLQASGNMKVPSILFVTMAVLDVIFNYVFIYACGMGAAGAALGTGLSETVISLASIWYLFKRSEELASNGEKHTFIPDMKVLRNCGGITGPLWLQNILMRGAFIASTLIIAPLGAVAIAANAFAITAESFCYMPGYGLEEAATTLVGQSLGANRRELAKRFTWITISMGAAIMTFLGALMFIFAPQIMGMLSIDPEVVSLGAEVLRIEAFAETLYAVSIVAYGACVGTGNTLMPTILNFSSMWFARIGLALILTPKMGLTGYWVAMCVELNVRGLLFLWHMKRGKWLDSKI